MNQKITFPELVNAIAESTGYSKHLSEEFLKELFALITNSLASGENVKIKKLGTFKVVDVEARKSVKVGTGEEIEIPGHKKVTFTPDKELAEAINLPFAAFETIELNDSVTDEMLESTDCETELPDKPANERPNEVKPPLPLTEWDEEDETESNTVDTQDETDPQPKEIAESIDEDDANFDSLQDYNDIDEDDSIIVATSDKNDVAQHSETNIDVETLEITDGSTSETSPAAEENATDCDEKLDQNDTMQIGSQSDMPQQNFSVEEQSEEERIVIEHLSDEDNTIAETASNRHKGFLPGFLWGIVATVVVMVVAATAIYFINPSLLNLNIEDAEQPVVVAKVDTIVSDTTASTDTIDNKVIIPETKPSDVVVYDTISLTRYLTTMAREHYGNYHLWPYIYEENSKILGHPDRIRPGTRVVIPSKEKYNINPDDPECIKQAKRKGVEIYNRYKPKSDNGTK